MSDKKKLDPKAFYNCEVVATKEAKVYHASTAENLRDKGVVTVGTKIKKYVPKGAKE